MDVGAGGTSVPTGMAGASASGRGAATANPAAGGGSSSGAISSDPATYAGSTSGAMLQGSSSGTPAVDMAPPTGGHDGGVIPLVPPRVVPDAFAGAPPFVSMMGRGAHNPGQSCMKSGCHGAGGNADGFLIGGTVYADYAGTIPAPGVEIRVRDMAGNAVSVYSGQNGNFYIGNGGGVTFPAIVGARDGMTTRPMVTVLTGTMRSCASAGCHIVGGSPMTGAYYPIHVP